VKVVDGRYGQLLPLNDRSSHCCAKALSESWRLNMRPTTIGMLAAITAASLGINLSTAHAQNCNELWVERNSIYKEAGYCFHTPRAIQHFGNAGCKYDNEAQVPLSSGDRARIAEITRMEQRSACNR
jgi:YARHG domain